MLIDSEKWEQLPCKLTATERDERATEMAKVHHEMVDAEDAAKAAAAAAKEQVKQKRQRVAELALAIETGAEPRMVRCVQQVDVRRGAIETIRTDTGEVVWSRPMTVTERERATQGDLFDASGDDDEERPVVPS